MRGRSSSGLGREGGWNRRVMDNDVIDGILDNYQGQAGSLIRVMMEIQEENHWLPREILAKISEKLEVPFSRVLRIASYYKTFSLTLPKDVMKFRFVRVQPVISVVRRRFLTPCRILPESKPVKQIRNRSLAWRP